MTEPEDIRRITDRDCRLNYPRDWEAPRYVAGVWITLTSTLITVAIGTLVLVWAFR